MTQYQSDAEAMLDAWRRTVGTTPSKHAIALCVAVGTHETLMGRAWPGTNNIGACTVRGLSADDKKRIAEGVLKEGDVERGGVLHRDYAPGVGWYFTWFGAFPTLVEGCVYFLKVLAVSRPGCRKVLDDVDSTPRDLAEQMFLSHYYTGIHDPKKPGGAEANINDYASALNKLYPAIYAQLTGDQWHPELDPAKPEKPIKSAPTGEEITSATKKPSIGESVSIGILLLSFLVGFAQKCTCDRGNNNGDAGIDLVD